MFSGLLFSLIVGASFSCADSGVLPMPIMVDAEMKNLPKRVCHQYAGDFEALSFKVIKDRKQRFYRESDPALTVDVGDIKAGRLSVSWQKDGEKVRSVWLTVDAQKRAWVYKKPVSFGQKIRRSDVRLETVNIANSLGVKTLVDESPKGMIAKKRSRKGQLIDTSMVGVPALVKRNDRVKVIVKNKGLTIESRGLALSTGWRAGDLVSVKVNQATESIRAKVVGVKEVHVEI